MRSQVPKALHPVAGKAMLRHVLDALQGLHLSFMVVVVGHGADQVRQALGETVLYAEQPEPLGTGNAVLQARHLLGGGPRHLMVVNADMPLVQEDTLRRAMEHHAHTGAAVTIVTCLRDDAEGLGRLLRSEYGAALAVIEEAEATPEQRAITETNEGIYCLDAEWVWEQLEHLPKHRNNEHYLTDLVGLATATGRKVSTITLADPYETMGVNDRVQLASAESVMRQRVRERLMLAGVTIIDPPSTFVDATVEIGPDSVLLPNTTISGQTSIGQNCRIGPGSMISDCRIADGCEVVASMLESATLEDGVTVGPFSHLRPGSHIEAGVHLGNYVEVKNSRIGRDTKVGHFSYLGDATVGRDVNIGAGAITCNFDGVDKHPTHIGDGAFIGCDTMLVAPVSVGEGAATGAGSVVTRDVPPGVLAAGSPARPVPGREPPGHATRE
ncbi:MAG: bifunctional UDP-N-acetylglucosamine diphosphorylase/glucosamine-1-phosphate N-acetyltransferase GlmU [Chloroflexi bacterium]|nr:bifunctional UDP-N-acetylglucosamine diphosphorylase/glucosamine-1-phosphate N-acetyltransferase GlmU [Chloroflexota bacterium]